MWKLALALQIKKKNQPEILTALLAMDGVMVAALYRELDGDRVKVSLRSKGDLDVHLVDATLTGAVQSVGRRLEVRDLDLSARVVAPARQRITSAAA